MGEWISDGHLMNEMKWDEGWKDSQQEEHLTNEGNIQCKFTCLCMHVRTYVCICMYVWMNEWINELHKVMSNTSVNRRSTVEVWYVCRITIRRGRRGSMRVSFYRVNLDKQCKGKWSIYSQHCLRQCEGDFGMAIGAVRFTTGTTATGNSSSTIWHWEE